jgi:hypothetical protein
VLQLPERAGELVLDPRDEAHVVRHRDSTELRGARGLVSGAVERPGWREAAAGPPDGLVGLGGALVQPGELFAGRRVLTRGAEPLAPEAGELVAGELHRAVPLGLTERADFGGARHRRRAGRNLVDGVGDAGFQ